MDKLRDFINGFSRAEKIYCRRYLFKDARNGKDPVLKTMFGLLLNGAEEKKVKEKLFGKKISLPFKQENSFRVHKNKLMKVLLDALADFEGEKNPDIKVHRIVQRALMLRNKGLGNSAEKYYEKGLEISLIAERFDLAETCLFGLLNLSQSNFMDRETAKKRTVWRKKMRYCRKMQSNIQHFSAIMDKLSLIQGEVNSFKYSKNAQLKKIKKVVPASLLNNENDALCFEAKCVFYLCKSKIAGAAADYPAFQFYTRQVLVLMESHPEKIPYYQSKYRFALNQYLNSCLHYNDFSDFDHFLSRLEDTGNQLNATNGVRHWLMVANLKMNRNFKEEKAEENISIIKSSEKLLPQYERLVQASFFTALYTNFVITLLYCGQFRAALRFINKLLNDVNEKSAGPLLVMIKISNLVVHHELRNEKLLESLLRHYEKTATSAPFSKVLAAACTFFEQLTKAGPNRNAVFQQFAKKLEELKTDTAIAALLEDFYIEKWLSKKIQIN